MAATVTLGRHTDVKEKKVRQWVGEYLTGDAYGHHYDAWRSTTRGRPLDEADLLAPNLLDAEVRLKQFVTMKPHLDALNEALLQVPKNVDLVDATDGHLDAVAGCVAVLDEEDPKGWGVTTLSKVLHRKRPRLLPLWDSRIRGSYLGKGAPLRKDRARSSSQYYRAIALAMQHDLGQPVFADLASEHSGLTPLRALDIAVWMHAERRR